MRKLLWVKKQALALMDKHGLHGWTFDFNRAKRQVGVCKYPTRTKPGCIELSMHYCERNDEEDILDTILHEIAHALVGPSHGHDEVWKAKCREIGARPERCYDVSVIDMPKGKWRANCPCCGREFHRHRRPKTLTGWWCKKCGKEKGQIVWQVRTCG